MARGDKEYYRKEVCFIDSPEFVGLSGEAWKLYDVLQSRCIQTRRVTLYGLTKKWMAAKAGISHQRVGSALGELASCLYGKGHLPLIIVEPEGGQFKIKVEGMDRNNPKFKFSDSPFDPHIKPYGSQGTERNGTERNSPPPPVKTDGVEGEKSEGERGFSARGNQKEENCRERTVNGLRAMGFEAGQIEDFLKRRGLRYVARCLTAAHRDGINDPVKYFLAHLERNDLPTTDEEKKFWGES